MNTHFNASVRRFDHAAVMDLHGEINGEADGALNSAYAQATQDSPAVVMMNFKDVDYINSKGIALIVGLLAQARKTGRKLVTYGLSSHYVEIFNITRLSDFMDNFPDEQAAMGAARAKA
ncbi:MAG: STAS domain-containing protein [Chloroflexi bacterium]|nr:STAS domain-containing protein [Chloroflexota bacterium]